MEQAIRTGNYFVTADRQARTLDQGQTRSDQVRPGRKQPTISELKRAQDNFRTPLFFSKS